MKWFAGILLAGYLIFRACSSSDESGPTASVEPAPGLPPVLIVSLPSNVRNPVTIRGDAIKDFINQNFGPITIFQSVQPTKQGDQWIWKPVPGQMGITAIFILVSILCPWLSSSAQEKTDSRLL